MTERPHLFKMCSKRATSASLGTSAGEDSSTCRELLSLKGGDCPEACPTEALHTNLQGGFT
jgi:hypothetical protein